MNMFDQLKQPFPSDVVSWRVGSMSKDKTKAKALAYLDARDVMRRLDDVVGPGNWEVDYPHVAPIIICKIGIEFEGRLRWKANGAGQTDIEGEKGGSSDAFKRAAVLWGIGRYLYDIDSPWVRINEWKQIADDELPRLRKLLEGQKPVSAHQARKDGHYPRIVKALRDCGSVAELSQIWKQEQEIIAALPDGWRSELTTEKDRLKEHLSRSAA